MSRNLYRFAHTLETCDAGLKPILEKLFTLYMVSTIEQNLGNLLILGIIKPDQVINISYRSIESIVWKIFDRN